MTDTDNRYEEAAIDVSYHGHVDLASKTSVIAELVLNTVSSDRTRRDYGRALNDFTIWFHHTDQRKLNKASVQAHITALKARGVTDSSINQRLAAIRKLALEAADNGLIDEATAQAIKRVKNEKVQGKKIGNWLTKAQVEQVLAKPDTATLKGLRDRAILGLMFGAGLRREELVRLEVSHLQQREGRWVIVDLTGKHGRTRSIPIASWIKALIDQWLTEAEIKDGVLFPRILKGGHVQHGSQMTDQAIWNVIKEYADISPHDARRTFSKLAHKAGAPIEQIQQTLGHASIQTTERYLGVDQDFQNAPSDYIKLNLDA